MAALLISALAPIALSACGSGDAGPPDDERTRQIAGVSELATNAYASVGPEGLYDYLAPQITERCSKEALVEALKDQPMPDGFRRVAGVEFDGDDARARVVQIFADGERESEWIFVSLSAGVWRLVNLPSLERCAN